MEEVGERLHAVDENHRDPLPIALLELGVSGDVDLLQLEWRLFPHLRKDPARAFAEVAASGVEERDPVPNPPRGRAHV
jgi:hypothetical protein